MAPLFFFPILKTLGYELANPKSYQVSLALSKYKDNFKEGKFAAIKESQNNMVGFSGCQYI